MSSLLEFNIDLKYWKPNHPWTQKYINIRTQDKCKINDKNNEWIEDYINILKESRLKESQGRDKKKVNKVLQHSPTDYITKLNELIYAGAKLVCNKIGIVLRNQ